MRNRFALKNRTFPILWTLLVVATALWLTFRVFSGPFVNTNLLSLLPAAEIDPVVSGVVAKVQKRFERQMVWLVGADDRDAARAAAVRVHDRLAASGEFADIDLYHDGAPMQALPAFFKNLRFGLLSDELRAQLSRDDDGAFARDVLRRYFSPRSPLSSEIVTLDPLLLLPAYLGDLGTDVSSRIESDDGMLTVRDADKVYVLLTARLKETPFSFDMQARIVPVLADIDDFIGRDFPGGVMIGAGVLPHAIAGTSRAIDEMTNVGFWSVAGIVVLLIAVFRSSVPLLLSLASIGVGVVGGMASCLILFGQIHLLTMVLGSSLLGISIDYSFHFFCRRFDADADWRPVEALQKVLPGISLGLITSVIGFAGLWLAPFHGMREIATFCIVGLGFSFGCVVAWYPALARGMRPVGGGWMLRVLDRYRGAWETNTGRLAICALLPLLVLGGIGIGRLVVEDNVRLLQTPDPAVIASEKKTRDLIGRNLSSQFFLVEGVDEADFLRREEALTARLRTLMQDGRLTGYQAISDFVPSPSRQLQAHALLRPRIVGPDSVLAKLAPEVGLSDAARADYVEAFEVLDHRPPVPLSAWLADPVSGPYRHLWLGESDGGVMGIVGLKGVFDMAALQGIAAETAGVHFVDPAGQISALFAKYRHQTGWLTFGSYLVVTLILVLRYGAAGSVAVLAVPVCAALFSLGCVGLLGEPINLFNVMALLLVLGVGIDYAIFFREMGREHDSTFLAIALSSITTMLAFGLLVLSTTPAVHSFGLTILIGIVAAFILAPLAGWRRRGTEEPAS